MLPSMTARPLPAPTLITVNAGGQLLRTIEALSNEKVPKSSVTPAKAATQALKDARQMILDVNVPAGGNAADPAYRDPAGPLYNHSLTEIETELTARGSSLT